MKSMKGKNLAKVVEVKFDTLHGKVGDNFWIIEYNKVSKRYDLQSDDGFFYSHISLTACQNKAKDKGVAWK